VPVIRRGRIHTVLGSVARTSVYGTLDEDPGARSEDDLAARGIDRLPATLTAALDALEGDDAIAAAMGDPLHGSYLDVTRSEWAQSTDDGEWEAEYLDRAF